MYQTAGTAQGINIMITKPPLEQWQKGVGFNESIKVAFPGDAKDLAGNRQSSSDIKAARMQARLQATVSRALLLGGKSPNSPNLSRDDPGKTICLTSVTKKVVNMLPPGVCFDQIKDDCRFKGDYAMKHYYIDFNLAGAPQKFTWASLMTNLLNTQSKYHNVLMQTGKKQKTSITADDIFKRNVVPKKSENTANSDELKDDNNGQENEEGTGGDGSQDDSEKLQLNKRRRPKKNNDQQSQIDEKNLKGEKKYKFMREQLQQIKLENDRYQMVFEWFQARNNITPSRIQKEKQMAQYDDMIRERKRSQNPDNKSNRYDGQSSTMKSYHRIKTISPISDKFANTSPASGFKSEFNFTNLNRESKTPAAADDNYKKIETFFDAYNSRNQQIGGTGGTVPNGQQQTSSASPNPFKGTLLKSNTMSGTMFKNYQYQQNLAQFPQAILPSPLLKAGTEKALIKPQNKELMVKASPETIFKIKGQSTIDEERSDIKTPETQKGIIRRELKSSTTDKPQQSMPPSSSPSKTALTLPSSQKNRYQTTVNVNQVANPLPRKNKHVSSTGALPSTVPKIIPVLPESLIQRAKEALDRVHHSREQHREKKEKLLKDCERLSEVGNSADEEATNDKIQLHPPLKTAKDQRQSIHPIVNIDGARVMQINSSHGTRSQKILSSENNVHFTGGSFGQSYRLGSSHSKKRFETNPTLMTASTNEIKDYQDSYRDDIIEPVDMQRDGVIKKKSVKIVRRPPRQPSNHLPQIQSAKNIPNLGKQFAHHPYNEMHQAIGQKTVEQIAKKYTKATKVRRIIRSQKRAGDSKSPDIYSQAQENIQHHAAYQSQDERMMQLQRLNEQRPVNAGHDKRQRVNRALDQIINEIDGQPLRDDILTPSGTDGRYKDPLAPLKPLNGILKKPPPYQKNALDSLNGSQRKPPTSGSNRPVSMLVEMGRDPLHMNSTNQGRTTPLHLEEIQQQREVGSAGIKSTKDLKLPLNEKEAESSQKLRDELMEALELVDSNRVKILDNDFMSNGSAKNNAELRVQSH